MLSQKDIIHISIEVIVISSLFLFVNWKNSKLRNEITFVSNRLDRLEQIIATQNEVLARLDPRFRQLPGIDDVSMMANVPFGSLASMIPRNTIATQTEEPNPVVDVAKDDREVAKDDGELAKVEVAKDDGELAKVEVAKDDGELAKVEVAKDDGEVAKDEIVDLQDIVENKVDDLDFDQLLEQELDELKNR
jgi:hypothetical protein